MAGYEPKKIAGLQMLDLRDERETAMFFPVAADAVEAGPAPIGPGRVHAFFESAVEAADHAATASAATGATMKVGVARILPGLRVRDAHRDVEDMPGAYAVEDNDGDREFPSSPLVASSVAVDVKAFGADGMHLGGYHESRKLILFDQASFVIEGSFDPVHAAEIDRRLGMYEQRGVAHQVVGVASGWFEDPEATFSP